MDAHERRYNFDAVSLLHLDAISWILKTFLEKFNILLWHYQKAAWWSCKTQV